MVSKRFLFAVIPLTVNCKTVIQFCGDFIYLLRFCKNSATIIFLSLLSGGRDFWSQVTLAHSYCCPGQGARLEALWTHAHPEHTEQEITLMSSEFHEDYAITFSMTTYITRYGSECCCMRTCITLWWYGVYGTRRNLKLNLWENSRIAVVEVPLENLIEASVATQQPSW